MAQQDISYGTSANDGTGDVLRVWAQKCQEMFTELYTRMQSVETSAQDSIVDVHSEVELFSGDVKKTLTVFKGGFFCLKINFKQRATTDQYVVNCFSELGAGIVVSHELSDLMTYKEAGSFSKGSWTFNKFYSETIGKTSNADQQGQDVGEGVTEDNNYDDSSSNYYKENSLAQINLANGAVNWTFTNDSATSVTGTLREVIVTGHIANATLS